MIKLDRVDWETMKEAKVSQVRIHKMLLLEAEMMIKKADKEIAKYGTDDNSG